MSIEVFLRPHEVTLAYMAGTGRQLRAVQLGRKHKYGLQGGEGFNLPDWRRHVNACGGELAVSRGLDRYWEALSPEPDHGGDVGCIPPKLHVRSTDREDGRLILRPSDPDDAIFILVVGELPRYTIIGWIRAEDGKTPHNVFAGNGRDPCWMVRWAALRPTDDLPRQPRSDEVQLALPEYCTTCGDRKSNGVCPNADNSAHREVAA